MIPVYDNLVAASVFLWSDNLLTSVGQGYANFTGQFIPSTGRIDGYYVYAAPHRQFVTDSSVAGATVPTGVYINNTFTGTGNSLKIDYLKGAVLSTNRINGQISGIYSYKEVNIYAAETSTEKILFERRYNVNPRNSQFTGVGALDKTYPCLFIEVEDGGSDTLCLGGELARNKLNARLTYFGDSRSLLTSVSRLFASKKESHIPLFNNSELPYNYFGGLKTQYNYSSLVASVQASTDRDLIYIKDVRVSKFTDAINALLGPNIYGAFIDLDLEVYRTRNEY